MFLMRNSTTDIEVERSGTAQSVPHPLSQRGGPAAGALVRSSSMRRSRSVRRDAIKDDGNASCPPFGHGQIPPQSGEGSVGCTQPWCQPSQAGRRGLALNHRTTYTTGSVISHMVCLTGPGWRRAMSAMETMPTSSLSMFTTGRRRTCAYPIVCMTSSVSWSSVQNCRS